MKAAVLYEVRQPLRIEDLEMPDVHDDDVLSKSRLVRVCHTDLKVIEGEIVLRRRRSSATKSRERWSRLARSVMTLKSAIG